MSMDNSSTVKTMALGRPFQLGMLYDLRTDTLIPHRLLWNSVVMPNYINYRSSPSTICEIHTADSFTKRADLLGLDANLKMSVLTDLVELSRSAELIKNRRTTQHKRRFILKYSVTTCLRELNITHLTKNNAINQQVFQQEIATHVVTGVLYGAEVYFVFDRILFKDENDAKTDMMVMKLLEKISTARMVDNDQLNFEDNEKEIAQSLTCMYHSDFHLHSNPITFEEAVKLFKQLPKFLGENQENVLPKQVWIYPLHLLDKSRFTNKSIRQVNNDLVIKLLKIFERLHRLEIIVNDLINSLLPTIFLQQTEQQLSIFCIHIHAFEIAVKKQIKTLLPEIRSGIKPEIALANLLENIDLFSINERKLDSWIQFITDDVKILTGFFNDLGRQININISDFSLLENHNNLNYEFMLCLIIHLTEKNDSFLNEMFKYLNDDINTQYNQNTNIDCWLNQDNIALIRNKVALFCEFAAVNKNKQNVKFIAEQKYADDFQMKKGVSVVLYRNGATKNFQIPSRPGQPYASNISKQNVTLAWSPPVYGSRSVQRYKIYGQINTSALWTLLLTTTDATQSTVIANLVTGKYQFRIQGITLAGDTAVSDISSVIDMEEAPPILRDPKPEIVTASPIVTPGEITTEKAVLDVTPAWFEPVKPVNPNKIRFPANYNSNLPIDVRTYNCLSSFRSMTQKTDKIDFVAEPFTSKADNIETLIVVLNELAYELGARLSFTHTDFKYDDSDYRTACGVTNLGSIHSLLASDGSFETAKFNLHLDLDYNRITVSTETLKTFILTTINDLSTIAQCNKDFIRVFSVSRVASVLVGFGITTPQHDETVKVADALRQKLNRISPKDCKDIFQHLIPERYDYKLEPALAFLQLQKSDFEPRYNRAYPDARQEVRGGHPYYFPQGWYRHALRVIDKYPGDQTWLGMNNSRGEWAVAYHGTNSSAVSGIKDKGLLHSFVTADVVKDEARQQNPSIPDVKGIYVATHCEGGASGYSSFFKVKDSTGRIKTYQVVFQCRVQPEKFTQHKSPVREGMAWRVFDEKAIRPYGLLLKNS